MATIDYLTALPSELIQNIASYLFANHDPERVATPDFPDKPHDLDHLAATCRTLRHEVNSWAQSFLLQHQAITKYKPPAVRKLAKNSKNNPLPASSLRHASRHSQGLLSWSSRKCVFCGKLSRRSAVMASGLRCCETCDETHWPHKITEIEADRDFALYSWHLEEYRWYNTGALRKGVDTYRGRHTTLYMRKDVKRLAKGVHGNMKACWRRRRRRHWDTVFKEDMEAYYHMERRQFYKNFAEERLAHLETEKLSTEQRMKELETNMREEASDLLPLQIKRTLAERYVAHIERERPSAKNRLVAFESRRDWSESDLNHLNTERILAGHHLQSMDSQRYRMEKCLAKRHDLDDTQAKVILADYDSLDIEMQRVVTELRQAGSDSKEPKHEPKSLYLTWLRLVSQTSEEQRWAFEWSQRIGKISPSAFVKAKRSLPAHERY